jgi:hypothetical protein
MDKISGLTLADDVRRSSPDARLKPVKDQRENQESDRISFFGGRCSSAHRRKKSCPTLSLDDPEKVGHLLG